MIVNTYVLSSCFDFLISFEKRSVFMNLIFYFELRYERICYFGGVGRKLGMGFLEKFRKKGSDLKID